VNMNGRNKNGWTPLIWAAITGSTEVASLLIQAGCDIFIRDEKGMSALMWAAKHGHEE
ncbi:Fank1, partial [Symbiodinium pilosum]